MEVLVSIGLLATLMVTTLSIRSRHIRQIRRANNIERAVVFLDQQIATWLSSEDGIPTAANGELDQASGLMWSTQQFPVATSNTDWKAVKTRIEAVSETTGEVLVTVELLGTPREENPGS